MKKTLLIFFSILLISCSENPPNVPPEPKEPEFFLMASQSTIVYGEKITFRFVESPKGEDIEGYYWSLDSPEPSNWTTETKVSLSPNEGNHTFYAKAQSVSGKMTKVQSKSFTVLGRDSKGVVLQENAFQLSKSDLEEISEIKENSLTFSENSSFPKQLKVGDVIFGAHPSNPGLKISRVVVGLGKKSNTNSIVILTRLATIAEIIKSGRIELNLRLFNYSKKNIRKVIYDLDKNENTLGDQGVLLSDMDLKSDLKGYLDFSSSFKGELEFNLDADLKADFISNLDLVYKKEVEILTFYVGPFFLGPLEMSGTIKLYVGLDSKISGSFQTGFSGSEEFQTSILYDGAWRNTLNTDLSFEQRGTSLNTEGNCKTYLGIRASLNFYEIVGPAVEEKNYLKLSLDQNREPEIELYAGIEGSIGVETNWISRYVPSKYWPLVGIEKRIYYYDIDDNNQAPILVYVIPSNNETNVPVDQTLGWNFTDPEGDALKYDFYFGTSNYPPLKYANTSLTYYAHDDLAPSTKYYWKIIAKDGNTQTSTGVLAFTTKGSSGDFKYGSFTDSRDGRVYKTIFLFGREWLAENFDYNSPKSVYYNESSSNFEYGRLYPWQEAVDYAPKGWRLPTSKEWKDLADSLGGLDIAGGKLKEKGFVHWNSPNIGATNEVGFSVRGAGAFHHQKGSSPSFHSLNKKTAFWTGNLLSSGTDVLTPSFDYDSQKLDYYVGHNVDNQISTPHYFKFSVRYIKEN